jgi:GNAT superfamily N-acetyltransferase
MGYSIREVAGSDAETAETIHHFNSLAKECFPVLKPHHLNNGFWWLVFPADHIAPIAFAGLVPFSPFQNIGYLKRGYVKPEHRGYGLQLRLLFAREAKAKQLGWTQLVSECHETNSWSSSNFMKAGYRQTEPEQPWAANSVFWVKTLV